MVFPNSGNKIVLNSVLSRDENRRTREAKIRVTDVYKVGQPLGKDDASISFRLLKLTNPLIEVD